MKIKTTRFGEIEIDENNVITFVSPIWGFDKFRKFVLIETSSDNPLLFLQSLDDEALAFVVVNPQYFRPNYKIEIAKNDLNMLTPGDTEDLVALCIVVIPKDNPENMTANLKAPIIYDTKKNVAGQFLSLNEEYNVRHKILEEIRGSKEQDS